MYIEEVAEIAEDVFVNVDYDATSYTTTEHYNTTPDHPSRTYLEAHVEDVFINRIEFEDDEGYMIIYIADNESADKVLLRDPFALKIFSNLKETLKHIYYSIEDREMDNALHS